MFHLLSTFPAPAARAARPASWPRRRRDLAALAASWTLLAISGAAIAGPPAAPLGAHVHGQATLDVVIDGATLNLSFEAPLDSLLGFERAPRDERERDAVKRMAARLRDAEAVFRPTPAAGCTLDSVTLESSALAPELLGSSEPPPAAEPGHEGHADLDASWQWRCRQPGALVGGEFRLFDGFPRLGRVDAQVAAPRGQSAQRLTPSQRQLRW